MNTKEVNNRLLELKLNRSVPQNLLKSGYKKVTFWNSYLMNSERSSLLIVPDNYMDVHLYVINSPFKFKRMQGWCLEYDEVYHLLRNDWNKCTKLHEIGIHMKSLLIVLLLYCYYYYYYYYYHHHHHHYYYYYYFSVYLSKRLLQVAYEELVSNPRYFKDFVDFPKLCKVWDFSSLANCEAPRIFSLWQWYSCSVPQVRKTIYAPA